MGFRRSEVQILSARHHKGRRDNQLRRPLFYSPNLPPFRVAPMGAPRLLWSEAVAFFISFGGLGLAWFFRHDLTSWPVRLAMALLAFGPLVCYLQKPRERPNVFADVLDAQVRVQVRRHADVAVPHQPLDLHDGQ